MNEKSESARICDDFVAKAHAQVKETRQEIARRRNERQLDALMALLTWCFLALGALVVLAFTGLLVFLVWFR